jgi:hypothetical protein
MVDFVPEASSCQAFDRFAAVVASESAMTAGWAFACQACSAFVGPAGRRNPDLFFPTLSAACRLDEHLTGPLGDGVPFESAKRLDPGFRRLRACWIISWQRRRSNRAPCY